MKDDLKKIVTSSAGELIAVAAVVATSVIVDMISDRLKEISAEKKKPAKRMDEVDREQMSLFDTVTDADVIKELMEVEVTTMTPLDALNTLYRLQNRLKNRWNGN